MNIKTLSLALLATSTLLTACSKETYTVDYLKSNPEVLTKVLDDCKANKQSNENCQNANQANSDLKNKEMAKKLRNTDGFPQTEAEQKAKETEKKLLQ